MPASAGFALSGPLSHSAPGHSDPSGNCGKIGLRRHKLCCCRNSGPEGDARAGFAIASRRAADLGCFRDRSGEKFYVRFQENRHRCRHVGRRRRRGSRCRPSGPRGSGSLCRPAAGLHLDGRLLRYQRRRGLRQQAAVHHHGQPRRGIGNTQLQRQRLHRRWPDRLQLPVPGLRWLRRSGFGIVVGFEADAMYMDTDKSINTITAGGNASSVRASTSSAPPAAASATPSTSSWSTARVVSPTATSTAASSRSPTA